MEIASWFPLASSPAFKPIKVELSLLRSFLAAFLPIPILSCIWPLASVENSSELKPADLPINMESWLPLERAPASWPMNMPDVGNWFTLPEPAWLPIKTAAVAIPLSGCPFPAASRLSKPLIPTPAPSPILTPWLNIRCLSVPLPSCLRSATSFCLTKPLPYVTILPAATAIAEFPEFITNWVTPETKASLPKSVSK